MTTTLSSIVTTIRIRRGVKTPLSMSYDYIDSATLTQVHRQKLQSLIDPAIEQWWNSLSLFQRSVLPDLKASLKISVSSPQQKQES